jgi:hypothetical protein
MPNPNDPPPDPKQPVVNIKVAPDGRSVRLDLTGADGRAMPLTLDHSRLGALINHLQQAAVEAQRLRSTGLAYDPEGQPLARKANPARQIDITLDARGRGSMWRVLQEDGTVAELQLSLTLMESLREHLPKYISELMSRKRSASNPN